MTHDYKRHGTTDLFAAMNIATGEVLYDTKKAHKATDVLAFFKWIDLHVPPTSRSTSSWTTSRPTRLRRSPSGWPSEARPLASALHPHIVVVAQSHRALVQRAHRAASAPRRVHLGAPLGRGHRDLGRARNDDPKPFIWHKPAEEIIAKVRRGRAALTQVKSALGLLGGVVGEIRVQGRARSCRIAGGPGDDEVELSVLISRRVEKACLRALGGPVDPG